MEFGNLNCWKTGYHPVVRHTLENKKQSSVTDNFSGDKKCKCNIKPSCINVSNSYVSQNELLGILKH